MNVVWRAVSVAAMTSVLVGCVSVPQRTGSLKSTLPAQKLAVDLLEAAERCWARKPNFIRDGIVVEDRVGIRGTVISAFRRGRGIPDQPEFLIITINDVPGGASVEVDEGDYAAGSHLNLTADVNRWVGGDLTCGSRGG
jgi:hypothetical protein